MTGKIPINMNKLGTKRHILTGKEGIPLYVVTLPTITNDIKLVTDVVDNAIITRKKREGRRTGRQHLSLDKGYTSAQEEQELIKRGYLFHIPIKKKEEKKGEDSEEKMEEKPIPNSKKYSPKRLVVEREQTHGITGLGNYSQDMK